jgi:RING finger protein 113A
MPTPEVAVPFFKKKGKGRPATTRRQRSASPDAGTSSAPGPLASASSTTVVLPTRKAAASLLSAGTKRKRTDADADADERDGPDVQWTAAGSHQHAAQAILDGDEAAALLAKRARDSRPVDEDEDVPDDGLYRGQAAYKSHLQKSKEVPKAMRAGPQRSATTIRQVTIVDYQPDVCKDYKGVCVTSGPPTVC